MKKETSQEKTLNHFFYEMFSTKKNDGISFRNQSNKNTLFSACHTSKTSTTQQQQQQQ